MRRSFPALHVLAIAILTSCTVSDNTWRQVKAQLVIIGEKDQRYRSKMDSVAKVQGWGSKAVEELWEKQRKLDSVNIGEVDVLITRYGYPSREHVGDLSEVPFNVIRHSGDSIMATYLQLIVGAARNGDLRRDQVAFFEDRVLVGLKQPQEYATQIWIDFKENPVTHERYDSVYLWPVRDPARVESKRAAVGLDSLTKQLRHSGLDPAKGYLLRKSGETPR